MSARKLGHIVVTIMLRLYQVSVKKSFSSKSTKKPKNLKDFT